MKTRTVILLSAVCAIAVTNAAFRINLWKDFVSPQAVLSDSYRFQRDIPAITPVNLGRPAENTHDAANPEAAIWNISVLDTAANTEYLTDLEKDVILEMNKARTNPKKYAELYIQPRLSYYSGKYYSAPGQATKPTEEGAAAVHECIAVLNRVAAAGILKPEPGLSRAAKAHAADQGKTGHTGHTGSDRSSTEMRIKRYGKFNGSWAWAENIAYGPVTGRDIVCNLLINDGISDRSHRTSLLDKDFTQTGVGAGHHPRYFAICVITYADGYTSYSALP